MQDDSGAQVKMGNSITSLPGISDKGMATVTFRRASLPTVSSIRNGDWCESRIDGALQAMKLDQEYAHLSGFYWRGLDTLGSRNEKEGRGP
jgi:hypothetical protein